MGIISGIRKFLRLDNETIELDSDIIAATGLMIPELKDLYTVRKPCGSCFCSISYQSPAKKEIDLHLLQDFHIHDLHF